MKISIVVPLYNEEHRLNEFFPQLYSHINKLYGKEGFEFVCVNDGSKDKTVSVVERFKKEYPGIRLYNLHKNKGKGHALKLGVHHSRGDLIFFTDIDLSADLSALPKLEHHIEKGADIAIGSRRLSKSRVDVHQNIIRETMGKIYTFITRKSLGLSYVDMTCGLKGGRARAMKTVFSKMRINRWSFDPEMLYIAKKHGMKVKEQPVVWVNNAQSKVNLLVDAVRSLKEVVLIRIFDILGYYG